MADDHSDFRTYDRLDRVLTGCGGGMISAMSYYLAKVLPLGFDEAIRHVTETLKREGFGIITEIDMKETLKNKINNPVPTDCFEFLLGDIEQRYKSFLVLRRHIIAHFINKVHMA